MRDNCGPTASIFRAHYPSILLIIVMSVSLETYLFSQEHSTAQIFGVVKDAESQIPLPMVEVYVTRENIRRSATTDQLGHFQIAELFAGDYELFISTVGYGLVRHRLRLGGDNDRIEMEIYLTPGTQINDQITVLADLQPANTRLTLGEIDKLKTVLMDDPLRAFQLLPATASNDDFNTGFAFQGSGYDRVGILFDGIPLYGFEHTVQGLDNHGSTTLLSANLIGSLEMTPAGSSAELSGASAGYLNLTSRTGTTDRTRGLLSVSGSALLVSGEGPMGNGSWIGSARKSYIDWIVRRIEPNTELNFGFSDFFGKVNQAVHSKHQLAFSYSHGNTGIKDLVEGSGINSTDRARFTNDLVHVEWIWAISDQLTARSHFYFQQSNSLNRNKQKDPLWRNDQRIAGIRSVWSGQLSPKWLFEGGANGEFWKVRNQKNLFDRRSQRWIDFQSFEDETSRQEVFGQITVSPHDALTVRAGTSWVNQKPYSGDFLSSYVAIEASLSSRQTIFLSAGQSGQFPFFEQLLGRFGSPDLLPEKANNLQSRWILTSESGFELQAAGYYRRRKEVVWRQEGLWRLVDGRITLPSLQPYSNLLRDRSYGFEIWLGRHAPVGLTGWISYAWARSRWSAREGRWFPGNYDQPHALGLFAHYRWTSDMELTFRWKYAAGHPLWAYAQLEGDRYFLAEERNQERLPDYSRFDVRLGKSFNKDRFRVTIFFEVLNLTDRENVRFSGHDLDSVKPSTGEIVDLTEQQFPILPTAGIILEF